MPHHDHSHPHSHDEGAPHGHLAFGRAFALGSALNLGFVAIELVAALAAQSVALLSDGLHNLGDVLGLLLAWGAAWLAARRPSGRRTYGWGRGSIIAANLNAMVLLVAIGALAIEAIQRLLAPVPVASGVVMAVAAVGVVVNAITAWLFGHGHEDLNIRATYLHMAADAGVSLGVLVAAFLIRETGWQWLDPATSLAIALTILVGTWGLLRDAANLVMDGVPAGIERRAVEDYLLTLPGVVEVHDLHIWGLSTTDTALTAHLVHTEPGAHDALIQAAAAELGQRFHIGHTTLQMETRAVAETCRLRPAHVV